MCKVAIVKTGSVICAALSLSAATLSYSYADSSSATPSATHASSPHANPHKSGLTLTQRSAIAGASADYHLALKRALDGANVAIASARSIRDQAVAAAPKDKNVQELANSDFKRSTTQIWSAFKSAAAAAKAAYDAAIASIKAS